MAYQVSATKLQTYHRCPQAYYFRYELGLKTPSFFGNAKLGTALHQTLAKTYRDWHYKDPLPPLEWLSSCWQQYSNSLSPTQAEEGQEILENYYYQFIAGETAIARPLAVEGLIKGRLLVNDLEFKVSGRYDRLDFLGDGLELIDYKSTKEVKLPPSDEIDLQIGLYYIALEQRYHSCLQQLSLLYLRTGEKIVFEASSEHKQQVETVIGELAWRLRTDEQWEAKTGEHCEVCSFNRYCAAATDQPEPLPQSANAPRQMQLSLNL
jgi:putative RecB family exonuclease